MCYMWGGKGIQNSLLCLVKSLSVEPVTYFRSTGAQVFPAFWEGHSPQEKRTAWLMLII